MQDDEELTCLGCGHRDYGAGFVPLDKEENTRTRRREPSHGGSKL